MGLLVSGLGRRLAQDSINKNRIKRTLSPALDKRGGNPFICTVSVGYSLEAGDKGTLRGVLDGDLASANGFHPML